MSNILAMRWRIIMNQAPRPMLACSRCGDVRAYRHSGKFRLNAQGRRLDAWLIYRCVSCDHVWNRPVFERRKVRDIDPDTLFALQINDPALVDRVARDLASLRRMAERIEQCGDVTIRKTVTSGHRSPWSRLDIVFDAPHATALRTDRLLSTQLRISRTRLQVMARDGLLLLPGAGRRAMRQPVTDGMRVGLDLDRLEDGDAIGVAACDG